MTAVLDAPVLVPVDLRLPRVNLLPPEVEEQRRHRRVRRGALGAVALTVCGVVAMYAAAASGVDAAAAELTVAQARSAQLQAATAEHGEVTQTYARAAEAKAMLAQAMGEEVRFSRFLDGLALSIPEQVWMKDVTFAQRTGAPGPAGGEGGIGTVTFVGVTSAYDDVAQWLESLADQPGYAAPYLSATAETQLGDRTVVEFTSSVTLTADALSGRYAPTSGD
jgi:Tfp pilus assembly protein PilN